MSAEVEVKSSPVSRCRLMSVNSSYSVDDKDCLRRRLKFHFMDPLDKFRARKKFPWKLFVQVVKIIIVTVQLIEFGHGRYMHASFINGNMVTFQHLFMNHWDASYDTAAYPPSSGAYALYEIDDFYAHVDFAVIQYHQVKTIALGSYTFGTRHHNDSLRPVEFCKRYYENGKIWTDNSSYVFNSKMLTKCLDIMPMDVIRNASDVSRDFNFSSREYFAANNFSIHFDSLVDANLNLYIKSVHLKAESPYDTPDCYEFDISIVYDNRAHSGQVVMNLDAEPTRITCVNGTIEYKANENMRKALAMVLNCLVIVLCILSAVLCVRSLLRAFQLKDETVLLFQDHYNKELSWNDKLHFLNCWYVMIVVNDVLIVIGTVVRIQIDYKHSESFDGCSIMLGTGNLLLWIGVLRYLGFFPKYNILILTLKRALPNVLRFLLCALLIYCGFMLCGWVVLGPYHKKFQSISTTSEAMFSLINGDDMFATFSALSSERSSTAIWWYSRLYLYFFISLFIYVVLSLVMAIILDSYETIKEYYEHGFPKSDLHEFLSYCNDHPNSGVYRIHRHCWWEKYCACRRAVSTESNREEQRPLLA